MDMKIESNLVRSARERRAWSQQQLAQVSGLALRTIQRIEVTGIASYESAKALASCLEIPISKLRVRNDRKLPLLERLRNATMEQ